MSARTCLRSTASRGDVDALVDAGDAQVRGFA
jgi:hypothetical protein